jgi:hypothetical protein
LFQVSKQNVKPEDIEDLNEFAKDLRKTQVHLKLEVQRYFASLKDQMKQVGQRSNWRSRVTVKLEVRGHSQPGGHLTFSR